MKVEIEQYVRTKDGLIGRVDNISEYETASVIKYEGQYHKSVFSNWNGDSEVIKASYFLIDLIQEGDFVNGYRVISIDITSDKKFVRCDCGDHDAWYDNDGIENVMTKEMFEKGVYHV